MESDMVVNFVFDVTGIFYNPNFQEQPKDPICLFVVTFSLLVTLVQFIVGTTCMPPDVQHNQHHENDMDEGSSRALAVHQIACVHFHSSETHLVILYFLSQLTLFLWEIVNTIYQCL